MPPAAKDPLSTAPNRKKITAGLYLLLHQVDGPCPLWGGSKAQAAVLQGSAQGTRTLGKALLDAGLLRSAGQVKLGKAQVPLVSATDAAAQWLVGDAVDAAALVDAQQSHRHAVEAQMAAVRAELERLGAQLESLTRSLDALRRSGAPLVEVSRRLQARLDALERTLDGLGTAPAPAPGPPAASGELEAAYRRLVASGGEPRVKVPALYRALTGIPPERFKRELLALWNAGRIDLLRPGNASGLPDLELVPSDARGPLYYVEWRR